METIGSIILGSYWDNGNEMETTIMGLGLGSFLAGKWPMQDDTP